MILAWAAVFFIFVASYPTTVWMLRHSPLPSSKVLSLILAAGLGIGMLTWIMMAEGMLGVRFELWSILLPYIIALLPGTLLWWRNRNLNPTLKSPSAMKWLWGSEPANVPMRGVGGEDFDSSSGELLAERGSGGEVHHPAPKRLRIIGRLVVITVSAAVLLNTIYWPFYKADALGIYADQAHFIYATRGLIPMSLTNYSYYQAYPMLVQLSYTYSYLASGWEDPYLAKVIPALLAIACLGVVYYLGKTLYDEQTGWLALLLFTFAPLFGRWASSGYADLPMAFYYTLGALFAWRTWKANALVDVLISGIAIGLGAWTKNAMLPAVAFWLAFMLFGVLRKRISLKALAVALAACAVVAAPWYARNLLEAHLLMPATAWTDQASPNLSNLLVFITHPENLGFTGWFILIGIVLALVQVIRRPRSADRDLFLLIFALPFFAFWWLLASYDRRFLLYFLPILAVLAAAYALKLWERIPQRYHQSASWVLTLIAFATTVYVASISIDYKTDMLRNPLMSDAAKHQVVTTKQGNP